MHRPRVLSPRMALTSALLGGILLSTPGCNKATGVSLPEVTLNDTDGNSVSLADLQGKAVLLNFWFLA